MMSGPPFEAVSWRMLGTRSPRVWGGYIHNGSQPTNKLNGTALAIPDSCLPSSLCLLQAAWNPHLSWIWDARFLRAVDRGESHS